MEKLEDQVVDLQQRLFYLDKSIDSTLYASPEQRKALVVPMLFLRLILWERLHFCYRDLWFANPLDNFYKERFLETKKRLDQEHKVRENILRDAESIH